MIYRFKKFIENSLGIKIYRTTLPTGTNLFYDIDKYFGLKNIKIVFDIGANIGQSVFDYAEHFKNAKIYSFEPVISTFHELAKNTNKYTNVQNYNIGFGSEKKNTMINLLSDSESNSIKFHKHTINKELIEIDTIDNFSSTNSIKQIDFVKIDTEGYEIEVLKGSENLLKNQKISFILTECEILKSEGHYTNFFEIFSYLTHFNYQLFAIYDQNLHWAGLRKLSYVNALFISDKIVDPTNIL